MVLEYGWEDHLGSLVRVSAGRLLAYLQELTLANRDADSRALVPVVQVVTSTTTTTSIAACPPPPACPPPTTCPVTTVATAQEEVLTLAVCLARAPQVQATVGAFAPFLVVVLSLLTALVRARGRAGRWRHAAAQQQQQLQQQQQQQPQHQDVAIAMGALAGDGEDASDEEDQLPLPPPSLRCPQSFILVKKVAFLCFYLKKKTLFLF